MSADSHKKTGKRALFTGFSLSLRQEKNSQ
jgi:hypothetical protein